MPVHPQLVPLLEAMNATPLAFDDNTDLVALREQDLLQLSEARTKVGQVEDAAFQGPGGAVPVRIYSPDAAGPHPVLVYYHGGGFVLGSLDSHDELCRVLCHDAQLVVVSVAYRLAPEHPYPAAPDDCFAAVQWCVEQADRLNIDPHRIAVGGDSAGGNLAAATALRARDLGGPQISAQLLIYPVTAADFTMDSYQRNGDGFFLTADAMKWFWQQYVADPTHLLEPYACPLLADCHGLAPAYVVTAEYDPLCDEGERYAQRLQAAGCAVRQDRFAGMIHGFVMYGELLETARAAQLQMAAWLRDTLNAD